LIGALAFDFEVNCLGIEIFKTYLRAEGATEKVVVGAEKRPSGAKQAAEKPMFPRLVSFSLNLF
jgi:hypothetical protein